MPKMQFLEPQSGELNDGISLAHAGASYFLVSPIGKFAKFASFELPIAPRDALRQLSTRYRFYSKPPGSNQEDLRAFGIHKSRLKT